MKVDGFDGNGYNTNWHLFRNSVVDLRQTFNCLNRQNNILSVSDASAKEGRGCAALWKPVTSYIVLDKWED